MLNCEFSAGGGLRPQEHWRAGRIPSAFDPRALVWFAQPDRSCKEAAFAINLTPSSPTATP